MITTEFTIHKRQSIAATAPDDSFRAWCEQCLAVVSARPTESIAGELRIRPDILNEMLASGKLHGVEVGAQSPLVCANSLPAGSTQSHTNKEGAK